MWIYIILVVICYIYGVIDVIFVVYNEGVDWVSLLFVVYNGVVVVVVIGLFWFVKCISWCFMYMVCLVIGGFSFIFIYFLGNLDLFLLLMIGIGIVWASILFMFYVMLAGVLFVDKMGYYMGVFNFFIVIL